MRHTVVIAIVIAFVARTLHADEAQESAPQRKAGVASVVITPERPLRMAGYGGRTDPADTIYAFGNVADAALEAAHPGMTLRQRIARLGKAEGDGFVYTAPAGKLKLNSWGLFDTHGNVWEWCSDKYYDQYYSKLTNRSVMQLATDVPALADPRGPQTTPHHMYGDWRSMRGGAWCIGPISSRCASRSFGEASDAFAYTGFRVVADKTLDRVKS